MNTHVKATLSVVVNIFTFVIILLGLDYIPIIVSDILVTVFLGGVLCTWYMVFYDYFKD